MGRVQKAYEVLDGVRRGDEEPLHILHMVARQYRMIVRYCMLRKTGASDGAIQKQLGLQDFAYRGLKKQASITGQARAQQALLLILDAEAGLKAGRYRDEESVVDTALARVAALYEPD